MFYYIILYFCVALQVKILYQTLLHLTIFMLSQII